MEGLNNQACWHFFSTCNNWWVSVEDGVGNQGQNCKINKQGGKNISPYPSLLGI